MPARPAENFEIRSQLQLARALGLELLVTACVLLTTPERVAVRLEYIVGQTVEAACGLSARETICRAQSRSIRDPGQRRFPEIVVREIERGTHLGEPLLANVGSER